MIPEPIYQFEPELRVGMPRPARIKASDRATLYCIVLVVFGIALLICCFAAHDLNEIYALHRRGVTVQGIITDSRMVHGKNNTYYLGYSFPANGTSIFDEDQVFREIYDQKRKGDALNVTFLPDRPQIHRLGRFGEKRVRGSTRLWILGLLLWMVPFGLLCVGVVCQYRRDLQLARYGIPAQALIGECIAPNSNRAMEHRVTYSFETPEGELTKVDTVSCEAGKEFIAGETVTVLYEVANPNFSRLYRALLYSEIVSGTASFPR